MYSLFEKWVMMHNTLFSKVKQIVWSNIKNVMNNYVSEMFLDGYVSYKSDTNVRIPEYQRVLPLWKEIICSWQKR